MEIYGDPHVRIDMSADGENMTANFTTENGNGETINLLDTDDIDIQGKFDSLNRKDDNTYVTEETITIGHDKIEIDADDNTITINGRQISDCALEDGYCTVGGNKITKDGDKIIIETADGQKITVKDQGKHLDTTVEFKDYQTGEMGGMLGDSVSGHTNDDANDYIVEDGSGCDCNTPQDDQWLQGIIGLLNAIIPLVDQKTGEFLTALISFLEASQSAQATHMAA